MLSKKFIKNSFFLGVMWPHLPLTLLCLYVSMITYILDDFFALVDFWWKLMVCFTIGIMQKTKYKLSAWEIQNAKEHASHVKNGGGGKRQGRRWSLSPFAHVLFCMSGCLVLSPWFLPSPADAHRGCQDALSDRGRVCQGT